MIKIKVSKGIPYIWDVSDWVKLRTDHRILGTFDGAEGVGWSNAVHVHLPVKLSNVETQFLVKHGIAETVYAPSLLEEEDPAFISDEAIKSREEKENTMLLESYKEKRKEKIEFYFDLMIEGKKKKGKPLPEKESFIQSELDKITKSPHEMHTVVLKDPWLKDTDYIPYSFPLPKTYMEKLKFRVFEDFRLNKNYYLTPATKFGGDFLAYPDDPFHHHAEFIIMLEDKTRPYSTLHLMSQCRLSTTVKKTLLVAVLEEKSDKLMYYFPNQNEFQQQEL